MGVPALFRWLSKKYPKIVSRVIEDTPTKVLNDDGELVEVPLQYASENPNGFEVDNLYLDMNGIVHPCTHPEGRPAPETEEDMMAEVFRYTERVVNMARPRKVLIMAIDGVAPRAKMNQQRSRRFRAAQEAAEKEEERKESIRLFEAMGHTVSEETKNKKSWDSNAITPGTPFMDLLSASLKYWVANKLTNDPGWKDLKVIISDASVPGEGEHKIVDWIRRQRTCPDWDANTSHAIYGLDADLIMLALATHEPNFRVLREDVFFQGSKEPQTCRNCGKPGHLSANCKTEKKPKDPNVVEVAKPVDPKPFIWLDVSCLREYLHVELAVPQVPFPYDPELAIDDWIFLIFFVGNDFLPHMPSLEIREGAIDVLLKIWRNELPRMGGYLTNNGSVNLERVQYIFEGIAAREDGIFQKRKEDEERQANNQKRRRIEEHRRQDREAGRPEIPMEQIGTGGRGTMKMNGTDYVEKVVDTARGGRLHPSLPERPKFDTVKADEAAAVAPKRPGKKLSYAEQAASLKAGLAAMEGSNADVVNNRKAIRMANMSAAQALKAELEGGDADADMPDAEAEAEKAATEEAADEAMAEDNADAEGDDDAEGEADADGEWEGDDVEETAADAEDAAEEAAEGDVAPSKPKRVRPPRGQKRKAENGDDDEAEDAEAGDDDAPANPEDEHVAKKKFKVNPDGTVDQEDTVRLFEPGYRDRYYSQKFGVELPDDKFVAQLTHDYIEGLCWVLAYYYQGVPAWDWYYPAHHAPFAQDFKDVGNMKITFSPGVPFTPFGQLLSVFPAASRIHLPEPLQKLMTDEDSPIIDFYPESFDIDMAGKKMAWQGVVLLPFVDQKRLLGALKSKIHLLTEDEKRRNRWGDAVMFFGHDNDLYHPLTKLYGVKPVIELPLDTKLSHGVSGKARAVAGYIPSTRLETPLPTIEDCPDLDGNSSMSVRYLFPAAKHPHRSALLNGYRPTKAVLNEGDRERTRRGDFSGPGGRGGGRGRGGHRGGHDRGHDSGRNAPRSNAYPAAPMHPSAPPRNPYGGGGGGYPPAGNSSYGGDAYGGGYQSAYGAPQSAYGGGGYGGGGGGRGPAQSSYGGYGAGNAYPPPRNPFQAPSPYGAPPPSWGRPPPPSGGYQGGGGGAYGGGGGGRGGYNNGGGRGGGGARRW